MSIFFGEGMSDEFEAKAWEAIKPWVEGKIYCHMAPDIDALLSPKGAHDLRNLIAQALREAQPKFPSDEEIENTAIKKFPHEICDGYASDIDSQMAFEVGVHWLIERMKK